MLPLRVVLKHAESRLAKAPHPERAHQDAETLLRFAFERDRTWLLTHMNRGIQVQEAERYDAALDRRFAGEPIQYITGETEFFGLPFRVTRDVLIPRPETEHSVEKVLELAAQFRKPRIVDIGTGSGAIAVALAGNLPHAQITATDISSAALAIATENAARNDVANRIRFLEGDLLAPILPAPLSEDQFDIVVSNPPYVADSDRATLSVEVRDYEPSTALFAGSDGLEVYRRLIPQAFAALSAGGWIVLEIGCGQDAAIRLLLEEAGFGEIAFTADLQGIARVASARRI